MSNSIHVVGNLTRDPELRYTTSGRAVANFGIADNRRYQVNNEWTEEVSFHNVVAWAQLAENIAASLTKGDRVVITGRLQQRSWENDDGEKRSITEIVADEIGASLRFASVTVEKTQRSKPAENEERPYPTSNEEPF